MNLMNILLNAAITVNILNYSKAKSLSTTTTIQRPKRDLGCSEADCSLLLQEYGYVISKVEQKDELQVMDLLSRTFFVDEPINKAINLCPGGTGCPELEEFCRHDLMSGYSLKATDKNGKIIAVSISGMVPLKEPNDGNDIKNRAMRMQNPKFQKILYILANREEKARLWEKYPNETTVLEIKVVATDQDWRRRGIMTRLFNETEQLAKRHLISLLRVDTSSYYSALGAEKLGFTRAYSTLYSELKMKGEPIILPEYPHIDDRVFVKALIVPKSTN